MDNAKWAFINSFSGWFAAVGTIAAVVVSLYLAGKVVRPKARVSIRKILLLSSGKSQPPPEFIVFDVVNTGERPITITGLGWKVGYWKKRYAVQIFESSLSSSLPKKLDHGEQARWYIPLDARDEPWFEYFAKFLMPRYRLSCASLRGQVFLSVGRTFESQTGSFVVGKTTPYLQGVRRQDSPLR